MDGLFVHESAHFEDGVNFGKNCKIWHYAHVRTNATLGNNVIVGKSSFIDVNVKIGNNVKIQNLVSVYNGVTIGNDVFIGPHVVFTNDLYPRSVGEWSITPTFVDDGVSIGANSTIICGNNIGANSLIAAGSVVTKNIPPHALIAGNPGRLLGWVCRCARKIADKTLKEGSHSITCDHCKTINDFDVLPLTK